MKRGQDDEGNTGLHKGVHIFDIVIWNAIVKQCTCPLQIVRIASTCRTLWKLFHRHALILKWSAFTPRTGLRTASFENQGELVHLFIAKGADDWGEALCSASRGGHRDLVDFFISKGVNVNNWNWALHAASQGGHRDLVDHLIANGANNWNWNEALYYASLGGHRDLIDFFVTKGANNLNWALEGASHGGHRELIDHFISKGANDWYMALRCASLGGHNDLVEFFKAKLNGV